MPRKIFICFFVVLLLTTMVVPAFASSSGGTFYGVTTPAVMIDSVQFHGDGSYPVVDWANNSACLENGSSCLVEYSDVCAFDCSYYRNARLFETAIYPDLSFSSMKLSIGDLFLTSDTSFFLSNNEAGTLHISSIDVEGFFMTSFRSTVWGEDAKEFNLSPFSFAETFTFGTDSTFSSIDLARYFYTISSGLNIPAGFEYLDDILYFSDVTITINYYFDTSDPDVDFFPMHFTVSEGSSDNTFRGWFNSFSFDYDLPPISSGSTGSDDVLNVNWFDWLLDSVNAFLNFELAPSITLNKLFYVFLIIGLLLWFFKLFS